MEVIERRVVGKICEELCEDVIIVNDSFVAVVDGATAKSGWTFKGKSTGKLISEILAESFEFLNPESTCDEFVDFINQYIQNWYKKNGIYETIIQEFSKPTASVIIYSKFHRQIWLIGDCSALYGGKILENKLAVDNLYTDIRVKVIDYLLATGCSEESLLENDEALAFVKNLSKRQPLIQNKRFGGKYDYAVADGFETLKELIKIVQLPKHVNEIVFASDGYPKVFPTLKESENYLEYVKEKDPLCYKIFKNVKAVYKGQNGYDDRAYIRFRIN